MSIIESGEGMNPKIFSFETYRACISGKCYYLNNCIHYYKEFSLKTPRDDFSEVKSVAPDMVLEYSIPLPHVSHTLLSGHRVIMQLQPSWFPLYDRNPHAFVPKIMFAPPESYQKVTQRVWRTAEYPTAIELPIIK